MTAPEIDAVTAALVLSISPETRAAAASVVEYEIEREYGTKDDEGREGARLLAIAGLKMDMARTFYEANPGATDAKLHSLAATQLRILVRDGLAARQCECTAGGPGHYHTSGVRCEGHTEAEVPPVGGLHFCGACYCATPEVTA